MLKKVKKNVRELMLKGKVWVLRFCMAIYLILFYGTKAYAFQGSIYETGTKKLMADLLALGQAVAIGIVLVLWVVWEIQKRTAEDNEEGRFAKKQKGAIIGLIVAETIGTLVGLIGGYYGVSVS